MGWARWLALGGLLALAGQLQARLVRQPDAGFAECDAFFHAGTPPAGPASEPRLKICQRFRGAARFATLYSPGHRCPVFSAFRAARPAPGQAEQRGLLEPQIDDPDSSLEEMIEEADAVASISSLGSKQALNADYLDSDYESGQLFPFSLSSDLQTTIFPLTNSVPMTQSFRKRWHMNLNSLMDRALIPHCGNGEDLFIITGAVPSDSRIKDRVTVPEFVWLAACCAVPGGGWAMGFVKHTQGNDIIEDVMVRDLEKLLPSKPQLFRDNCGEAEQDTEKMKKILEVVNQVQDEERSVQSQKSPLASTRSQRSALLPPEAPEGGRSLLAKVLGFIATPFIKLFQLIYYLVIEVLKNILYLLWFVAKQVISGIENCLYRMGTAAFSYLMAIGEELVGIPWKVLKVVAKIIRAVLRILCCLLKAVCRVLSIPLRVLVDVAMFPVHTVGTVPFVCRDIALGLGGTLSLLFDTAFGTVGSLFQIFFSVLKRIGYKVTFDNSGEV
ncbi:endonuclease domain-containing 1 protein [Nannospalax galili]|uniref:Endonuclease domain containing 1 n=1 Tax=Nannospalax galili TaxID=1026970 RepID=A0A8C6RMQ7_NANGA|nr:endonuclease domain-containing 1 protein [Nannospalax galili]